ncbi:hypothetical protein ACEPPN_017513 [Leptodophora sp. 'Broadleaf-Isolate-01']
MTGSSVATVKCRLNNVPASQIHSNDSAKPPTQKKPSSPHPMDDPSTTDDPSTMDEIAVKEHILPCDSVSNRGDDDRDEDVLDTPLDSDSSVDEAPGRSSHSSTGGSAASSIPSEAGSMSSSTYEYSQEIFETYKAKVIQLCLEIGYGEPTEVDRMKGGSFNRIIGLSFDTPEKKQYILRIPREPYDETQDYEISDQVEVLLYLAQFDSLKVPSILAYDATTNNAIKSQWVLQSRLPGKPMQDVFYQLPLADRIQIAGEVAQLAIELDKIRFPNPGRLIGTRCLPSIAHNPPPTVKNVCFAGFKATEQLILDEQPLTQFLVSLFEYFKQNELATEHANELATQKMVERWSTLQLIATQMEKAGVMRIQDSGNALWHWDICSRNILIDQVNDVDVEEPVSEAEVVADDCAVSDTEKTEVPPKSAVQRASKGCYHSVQLSVDDITGNGHKHTVQVNIEDGSGNCCNHKVEVGVEDNMGKKYLHTFQIKGAQHLETSGTEETVSALTEVHDSFQPAVLPRYSKWVVSGVLDWDDALSVPPVLAGYQYSWLWCDEEERSSHWAYDRDTNPERPLTADELLVKANFDQIVARACPNFLEDTYGRGVWLRRLARFGIYGFHDSEDFARYTQFVKDWSMYYETLSLGATETDAEV